MLTFSYICSELITDAHLIQASTPLKESTFFNYGLTRRLFHLRYITSRLAEILPNKSHDFSNFNDNDDEIDVLINALYINLTGILDNLAWVLVEFYKLEIKKEKVGLFNKKFWQTCNNLKDLQDSIMTNDYVEWHKELKSKRDPIAHRVPLYIPKKIGNKENSVSMLTYYENNNWNFYEEVNKDLDKIQQIVKHFLQHISNI